MTGSSIPDTIEHVWQWLSDNANALQGLGGIAAVAAAVVAVFALMRAGLDSASRTRPYVVVEYRVPEFAYKRIDLVVRNAGPTAARDLVVEFDPPFTNSSDSADLGAYVARRYASAIDALGPSQEFVSILMVKQDDESASDVGPILKARVKYGPRKAYRFFLRYSDRFTLQRVVYSEQVFSESSKSPRSQLERTANALTESAASLATFTRALDRIGDSIDRSRPVENEQPPWRIRQLNDHLIAVENTSGQDAESVELTGNERLGLKVVYGDLALLRVGEYLEVAPLFKGGPPSALLTIDWVDATGESRTWTGAVPHWPGS